MVGNQISIISLSKDRIGKEIGLGMMIDVRLLGQTLVNLSQKYLEVNS